MEKYREQINCHEWNGIGDPLGNWIKYKGGGGERENETCKNFKR